MKIRSVITAAVVIMFALQSSPSFAQQQSADEQAVWKLEQAYWNYVKVLDLESYRNLWHTQFVGWPLSSSKPVRKDHITDWISLYKDKGLQLKSFSLEPAASQAVENLVTTHYWLTSVWADRQGHGEPNTLRITHTWIRTPGGWQIIAGMSAPGAPAPQPSDCPQYCRLIPNQHIVQTASTPPIFVRQASDRLIKSERAQA